MTAFRMKPSFTPRDWNGGFRLNQKLRFARMPSAIDRGWIDCSLAAMLISTDARSAPVCRNAFFLGARDPYVRCRKLKWVLLYELRDSGLQEAFRCITQQRRRKSSLILH